MISVGIDIGSTAAKAVVFDQHVLGRALLPTGWDPKKAGAQVLRAALTDAGLERHQVATVVGTGYGRISLPFLDRKITEISCHARGARFLLPHTRLVVDVGGQDTKVIALHENGSVADFLMNDKCAAGTGRFLQVMTGVLDVSLDELGDMALHAEPAAISSMCAVFAESEVIGLLARGVGKEAIAAGVVDSIARRIEGLVGRMGPARRITFTGGIAGNAAVCRRIADSLGVELQMPPNPQLVGALGAAVLGYERITGENLSF